MAPSHCPCSAGQQTAGVSRVGAEIDRQDGSGRTKVSRRAGTADVGANWVARIGDKGRDSSCIKSKGALNGHYGNSPWQNEGSERENGYIENAFHETPLRLIMS